MRIFFGYQIVCRPSNMTHVLVSTSPQSEVFGEIRRRALSTPPSERGQFFRDVVRWQDPAHWGVRRRFETTVYAVAARRAFSEAKKLARAGVVVYNDSAAPDQDRKRANAEARSFAAWRRARGRDLDRELADRLARDAERALFRRPSRTLEDPTE